MKNNIRNSIFFKTLSLISLFGLFVGCKKDLSDKLTPADGEAKLVFTVKGINNEFSNINSKLASGNNLKNSISESHTTINQALSNRVNIITQAIEQTRASNFDFSNTISNYKNKSKLAVAVPVEHDVRFRLLLFDSQTDTLVSNVDAKVNQTLSIAVTPGRSYYWRAYTHNSKEAMAPLNISADGFEIETSLDKDILWDGSTSPITATTVTDSLGIIFDYKLAEFVVNVDVSNLYGEVTELAMVFDENDYFKKGKLNLKTGIISNITPITSEELSLANFKAIPDTKMLQAKFYTVDPSNITNLVINVKKISVRHDGATAISEIHKSTDPIHPVAFSFANPTVAKSHVANMAFRYTIPTKKILHVIGHYKNDDDLKWGFAAQPKARDLNGWNYNPDVEFAPLNMIKEPKNFGTLPESVVRTGGFTHIRCNDGELAQKLNDENNTPDIVIIAVYYILTPADRLALKNYINAGGVVIMMTDSIMPVSAGNPAEVNAIETFLQDFLAAENLSLVYPNEGNGIGYSGPRMFELDHKRSINDQIINGPFGNLSGKYWGNDSMPVVQAKNLPIGEGAQQVTVYSDPQAINSGNTPSGVSMFKHNSKNFFWIGDGSFLSHVADGHKGWSTGWNAEPFATVNFSVQENIYDPKFNYTHYPMPKNYGYDYLNPNIGNVGASYHTMVYNAPLFANLMAWAVYQSEFFGKNKN